MKIVACWKFSLILLITIQPVQLVNYHSRQIRSARQPKSFQTKIIIGNQYSNKAEIYQLTFKCNTTSGCRPLPLLESDLVWSSPDTKGISEVKYVNYSGRPAILATTENGAIVYEYTSGTVLFHKELDQSYYINVHSAEVLPDGNVVVAGAVSNGIFAILYPDGNNTNQAIADTVTASAPFGHGVVYDKARHLLYAAGYLTFLVLEYSSGSNRRGELKLVKNVSLAYLYDEENKNENDVFEDGVHDLYPVDGVADRLWLTTGEHVFVINVENFTTTKFQGHYTIPSENSIKRPVAVKNKGGVKAISFDPEVGLVLAKSSPWFKEWMSTTDQNYSPYKPILLWTMPHRIRDVAYCPSPDYDTSENCKIDFDELEPIWFYKARIFRIPKFSY